MQKSYFLNKIDEVNKKFKTFINLWIASALVIILSIVLIICATIVQVNHQQITGITQIGGPTYNSATLIVRFGIGFLITNFVIIIILLFFLIQTFKLQSQIEIDYNLYLHKKIDINDHQANYKQERFEKILDALVAEKRTMLICFWICSFLGLSIIAIVFLIMVRSKINKYNKIIIDSFVNE